jgi:hypothetical protein
MKKRREYRYDSNTRTAFMCFLFVGVLCGRVARSARWLLLPNSVRGSIGAPRDTAGSHVHMVAEERPYRRRRAPNIADGPVLFILMYILYTLSSLKGRFFFLLNYVKFLTDHLISKWKKIFFFFFFAMIAKNTMLTAWGKPNCWLNIMVKDMKRAEVESELVGGKNELSLWGRGGEQKAGNSQFTQ